MKTNYLFPAGFKKIGWTILIPFAVLGLLHLYTNGFFFHDFDIAGVNVPSKWDAIYKNTLPFSWDGWDELLVIVNIVALSFISFSKEPYEDELIRKIRMDSLVWALLANYLIIIAATLFIYNGYYFTFLILNIFTTLILYIIKFRCALHHLNKITKNEE